MITRSQLRVYPEGQNYILTQKTQLLISPECSNSQRNSKDRISICNRMTKVLLLLKRPDLQPNSKDRSSRNYIVMLKLLIHWAGHSRSHWHWSTPQNPHLPTIQEHLYFYLTPRKLFTPNNVVICLTIHQFVGMTYEFFLTMFPPWSVGRPWIQWV